MASCPRTFCPECDQEMIHRDRKRATESSSGLGQVISDRGPRQFSYLDIDGCGRKDKPGGLSLLRIIEHSWPNAPAKHQQERTLRLLAGMIDHVRGCDNCGVSLEGRSGVFRLTGEIRVVGEDRIPALGPQDLYRITAEGARRINQLATEEDVFAWLEGRSQGARRTRRLLAA